MLGFYPTYLSTSKAQGRWPPHVPRTCHQDCNILPTAKNGNGKRSLLNCHQTFFVFVFRFETCFETSWQLYYHFDFDTSTTYMNRQEHLHPLDVCWFLVLCVQPIACPPFLTRHTVRRLPLVVSLVHRLGPGNSAVPKRSLLETFWVVQTKGKTQENFLVPEPPKNPTGMFLVVSDDQQISLV